MGQGRIAVVVFYNASANGLVGAEEGEGHRTGDDSTIFWAFFTEDVGRGATSDGCEADGFEELLSEDESLLIGTTATSGVGFSAVVAEVVACITVEETCGLDFGEGTDFVAKGGEVGESMHGFALFKREAGGVGLGETIGNGAWMLNGLGVVGETHRSHQ